jgi:hypothetical protein
MRNNNYIMNNINYMPTDNIRMFNKISTKNDGTVVVPVFPDSSLLMIETWRHGVDEVF